VTAGYFTKEMLSHGVTRPFKQNQTRIHVKRVDPMNALTLIIKITERTAPGRHPSYSAVHVYKALELMKNESGIGRKQLSNELMMGEGTIRTMIRRMKENDLIISSMKGMNLSSRGLEALKELENRISTREFPSSPITIAQNNYSVLVKGASNRIRQGVEQRDAALIAGAKGATTLTYDGEKLSMPGSKLDMEDEIIDFLIRNLKPEKGDVIIIGSSNNPIDAEIGAKAAALKLLEAS
jgi:predicted transcriptional regulator